MVVKAQRLILALGTAGVAATGAIFGSQLKEDTDKASKAQTVSVQVEPNTTPAASVEKAEARLAVSQHIASLEAQRAQLMTQRHGIEKKLAALEERKAANAEKETRRHEARAIMGKE